MELEIDNEDFCIRLCKNVAYIKVTGIQDEQAVEFFTQTIDQMLSGYKHEKFSSVCDLTDLILSEPKLAMKINSAIRKIAVQLNYEYNAIIVKPKFLQIIQAYIFSFYLKNINLKTSIFRSQEKALQWIDGKGYQLEEIKEYLKNKA